MDIYLKKFIKIRKPKQPKETQLRFLQRLNRLLTNGYPLLSALEIIKWDKQMIKPAEIIISSLKNGETIDQAFHKASFHPTITSYLYFVNANGDLQGSIEKCIDIYGHRMNYIAKFQQIIRYPLILLFIFSLLLYFIKQSVLPSFTDLFQTSHEASSTVVISMLIIDYLSDLVFLSALLFVITFLIWKFTKQKVPIEKQIKLYHSIPVYRKFLKLQTSFLFATHFSNLLQTGMSFKEILQHMANQKKLPIIAHYAELMSAELIQGLHVTNLISQFTLLERQLAFIFQKNVDSYALEKDLTVYGELLMEEIERKTMKAITFIQPVFFIILAAFIIFIYVTIMWPMFQLIKTI